MRLPPPRCAILLAVLCGLLLTSVACGGSSTNPPPGNGGTPPVEPPVEPPPEPLPPLDPLLELEAVSEGAFATSPACAHCHENAATAVAMRDPDDRPVGMMDLWRSTPMAAASRDPFWRAAVSAEVADNPSLAAVIEDKCLTCHAPMAHTEAHDAAETLGMDILEQDTNRAQLAIDGVSCTLCHQMSAADFGEDASYSGAFTINPLKEVYARHLVPSLNPMRSFSGYTATASAHVGTSQHCAVCHTLFTDTIGLDETLTGHTMAEQTPYLEWLNSVFNDEGPAPGPDAASCQDCHMPSRSAADEAISTQLARQPSGGDFGPGAAPMRDPYSRHVSSGANTLLLEILKANPDDLNPNANAAALDASLANARETLAQRTALLSILDPSRAGDQVAFTVRVDNLAGHKFPSGIPTRRAWLRVRVQNAAGTMVFASGEYDVAGRLVDSSGQVLPSEALGGGTLPHYDVVRDAAEIQVYEGIMKDPSGQVTWRLLRGAGYAKDNRLLPRGWVATHEDAPETEPRGEAVTDDDFFGGRDDVLYEVDAPPAAGPYTVEVDLLYQVLSPRFAAELFRFRTQETESFRRYYEALDRSPELVAHTTGGLP